MSVLLCLQLHRKENIFIYWAHKVVKKPKKGGGEGALPPDDIHLWRAVTKDVERLDKNSKDGTAETVLKDLQLIPSFKKLKPPKLAAEKKVVASIQPAQLDLRTDLRLKKGQMDIEARLDLHGHTQDSAHRMLNSFLMRCHEAGMRCVLVITGKGRRLKSFDAATEGSQQVGILKKMLPIWIDTPPIKSIVLKYYTAKPKDGGEGAYYIYLKRVRELK